MRVVYIIDNGDWSILYFLFDRGWVDDRDHVTDGVKLLTQSNYQMQYFINLKSIIFKKLFASIKCSYSELEIRLKCMRVTMSKVEKMKLLYAISHNTVAQILPCSLMNKPMKVSDELNPI